MAAPADERDRAVARAVRLLARRDHSTRSLQAKLARAGVSEEAQGEALETLAHAGYLDDERFAADRALRLTGRGYGDERIRADLAAHGVPAEAAEAAVAKLEPEARRALGEAARLGGGVRAARTLARRGFSEEALEAVVAGIVADDP